MYVSAFEMRNIHKCVIKQITRVEDKNEIGMREMMSARKIINNCDGRVILNFAYRKTSSRVEKTKETRRLLEKIKMLLTMSQLN